MNDIQGYERLLKQKTNKNTVCLRIGLIFAYLLWAGLFIILMLKYIGLNAPMIAFIPISTAILVLLTWKYTYVEFEYSFAGGTFYLAKIYGKKKRKPMLEADLALAVLIAPCDDKYIAEAERLSPDRSVHAESSDRAPDIWMLIYDEDKDSRILVFFEADERSLKYLRHHAPRVTARERLDNT